MVSILFVPRVSTDTVTFFSETHLNQGKRELVIMFILVIGKPA